MDNQTKIAIIGIVVTCLNDGMTIGDIKTHIHNCFGSKGRKYVRHALAQIRAAAIVDF